MIALLPLLAIGSWVDLRTHRIPNAIVLTGIVLAFTLQGLAGGPRGLAVSMAGMLVAGGLLLPFHLGRGMGAGDVKLMAMVGAFLGPLGALIAVAMTLVAGMLLSVVATLGAQAAQARFGLRLLVAKQADLVRASPAGTPEGSGVRMLRFPYALAIFAGTFASLWIFGEPISTVGSVFAPWIQ